MNDTDALSALEIRLTRLERRNRLLLSCLVATVGIGVFTASKVVKESATFSEVRADRFVLLDDRGRKVGLWNYDKGKYPMLSMQSDIYGHSLRLGENETGNFLHLHNDSGASIQLATGMTGSAATFTGEPGRGGTVSIIASKQNASVETRTPDRARTRMTAGGLPIESYKPGGKERDFYITRGSINLNGLDLRLNKANGDPILILPGQPLPQATEITRKKPFPLFGPRRNP